MRDMMDSNTIGIDPIYWKVLWYAVSNNHDMKQMLDSLSPNQFESKFWLVETLSMSGLKDISVQLYGGWNGFPLIDILSHEFNIKFLENIDIDESAIKYYRKFRHLKNLDSSIFRERLGDVCEKHRFDKRINLVINTSSEHMPDLKDIIRDKEYKPDCLFALQSNNMFHVEDHINCVNNEDELVEKSGLSNIMYKGSLDMPNGYKRFMVIGYV